MVGLTRLDHKSMSLSFRARYRAHCTPTQAWGAFAGLSVGDLCGGRGNLAIFTQLIDDEPLFVGGLVGTEDLCTRFGDGQDNVVSLRQAIDIVIPLPGRGRCGHGSCWDGDPVSSGITQGYSGCP